MNPQWFTDVCRSSLGHRSSQECTYDIARLVLQRGIPGDFVECGVYAGAQSALMAVAIIDHCRILTDGGRQVSRDQDPGPRRVHLFDSFTGIPKPGPHDLELQANEGGESNCSLEDVMSNMERWGIPNDLLVYHQGLFAHTVQFFAERYGTFGGKIALLRLDGDLYESTRMCMEYLYPLVSPGGYVIVDDFDLSGCRRAVTEYFHPTMPAPLLWRKPA